MYTLGKDYVPSAIHAGGLRYHGMAPTVSHLIADGMVKPVAYEQKEVFEAGVTFARTEGIIPALESAHAVAHALVLAREMGTGTILVNLSGRGDKDMDYVIEHWGIGADEG